MEKLHRRRTFRKNKLRQGLKPLMKSLPKLRQLETYHDTSLPKYFDAGQKRQK